MTPAETKLRSLLGSIAAATGAMLYLSTKEAASAVGAGLIIQNGTALDDNKNPATKLTELGFNFMNSPEGTDPASLTGDKTAPFDPPVAPVVPMIEGADGSKFLRLSIELPKVNTANRKSAYPTDKLLPPKVMMAPDGTTPLLNEDQTVKKAYDGFFLPPTAKSPDAAKAFSAVASAANKRYKDEKPPRKFTSRVMDGGAFDPKYKGVEGVAVFRIE